jgi:hypothetical protein
MAKPNGKRGRIMLFFATLWSLRDGIGKEVQGLVPARFRRSLKDPFLLPKGFYRVRWFIWVGSKGRRKKVLGQG